ncbi:MAG: aminotransferase class III-fold pyridoxal phosphate-dependent enzyme [Chloroflexota bacterium]
MSGHVFRRSAVPNPPVAVAAHGSTIVDADGCEYLDAAGGAIVVNVGHGRREIADAIAEQAGRLSYAHGSAFTTEPLERYAAEVAPHLPVDEPYLYPVSGGSEAIETAIKLARSVQIARGEADRTMVISRWSSYHGNTLGALDLSGRKPLRAPYEPWLGRFEHVSAAYPYRGGEPGSMSLGTASELAAELEAAIVAAPGKVAAFVGEPIVGATLGAVEPPEGYWTAIADVCNRHGVLLIADEVMTGFGRTGAWFGMDHYGVRPDILVAAKGATSGYWPFGFVAASGEVWETVTSGGGFTHGFTYSHQPGAATVAREVLRILEAESLVEASAAKGEQLKTLLRARLGDHAAVGDIRGRGLMVGVELVADRASKAPFPRGRKLIENVVRIAREDGLLLYAGSGNANGVDGDIVLMGPPFVVTDAELARIANGLGDALERALEATATA